MAGTYEPVEVGTGRAGTLPGRFEEHARRAPGAVAVRWAGRELTYGELDERADRLARHLAALGLGPGDRAAVALGRGTEVYVALLAVLKAGAAYVPVEPGAPDALLRHVLDEASPVLVVTEEGHRIRLADAGARALVCLDSAAGLDGSGGPPPVAIGPEDAAVVFTTSGTTGAPRCAVVEHRNLLAVHHGWRQVYGLTPADRILSAASLEFDVFTADWVRALCSGATLVLAPRDLTLDRGADIADLPALVAAERITLLELNVRTARRLAAHLAAAGPAGSEGALPGLRLLTVGAEKWWLDEHLAMRRLLGHRTRVVNVYGLAEAAVDSTYFEVRGVDEVPDSGSLSVVGVPFPGARVHVLGPDGRPVGAGAVGEIALAGPGLGRGYPGRPEETARRFVRADFDPDGRVLRTGDLGRLAEDGTLRFVARAAGVVGPADPAGSAAVVARVRLAARAEAELRGHPGVREAAVVELEVARGRRELVGYAVTEPGAPDTDGWSLSAYLGARLPKGGAPAAVVPVPDLPRTRAGKLDRDALPLPAPADHAAPRRAGGGKGYRGKGGGGRSGDTAGTETFLGCGAVIVGLPVAYVACLLTRKLWPGSTDISAVPEPYDAFFRVLHLFEWTSFGLGVTWLLFGAAVTARFGRPVGLSVAAHLSVFWLLASWWPQDNLYRTADRSVLATEVWLVYVFNIALMVSAAVVVRFLCWQPKRLR
ncbi:amino acid adenylation domain-containing protein [Kitasatospora sp. NPDC057692]|uniref:amino acid adenylation domain-containing protein n=1 Tax=Kitasatospora sp. NPDC057692 TaxID=3346215 RepID=UPI00368F79C8